MKKIESNDSYLTVKSLKTFYLTLFLITSTIFIFSSSKNPQKGKDNPPSMTYIEVQGFGFNIPKDCENITDHELGKLLKQINPAIDFVAKVNFPFGISLFSVSTYDAGEKIHIDTAFIETVNFRATLSEGTVDNYRLVDYGIRRFNKKVLRYKISCVEDSSYSIMYYFMRDDYSRYLNEIKLTCSSQSNLKASQDFLEKIALTANFDKH